MMHRDTRDELTRRGFLRQTTAVFGAMAAVTSLRDSNILMAAGTTKSSREGFSLAYRIAPAQWQSDLQFARLLKLLKAHPAGVDEVSFFEVETSSASLERMTHLAAQIDERFRLLRHAGFRPGINVLWTLGHGDCPGAPKIPFAPMVGHDGRESNACPCPNDAAFRVYMMQRYRMMAALKPAFLWVDDDFRMSHHGVVFPCFCPACLEKFGRNKDRATLVKLLDAGENGELREAWTEFCAASLESLAVEIGRTIREVDPKIEIGLMTAGYSHSTYAGYPIGRWMKALGATRGRPGHGYYTDNEPRQIVGKAMDVGRQVRDYPAEVHVIQYELEDYPYILLDKSARTMANECTAAIMMGCTGVAFNMLPAWEANLDDYGPLMQSIVEERPLWEKVEKAVRGLLPAGLWPADERMLMARRKVGAQGWFADDGGYDIQRPNQLLDMGVPLTPDRKTACGIVLAGKVAEAFSTDDLKTMLAGGVLLDVDALDVLWQRGLGELTGVRLGEKTSEAVCERLTDHKLNGMDAGNVRDTLVGPGVAALIPISADAATLATLVTGEGAERGCCFTVFTNRLQGRIAVSSYSPWTRLGMAGKQRQLRSVADWLSGGQLPVIIEQTARVAPLVRWSEDRSRVVVALLNLALDPTGPLTLRLRARTPRVSLLTAQGATELAVKQDGAEVRIEVPSIPAWHTAVLVGT